MFLARQDSGRCCVRFGSLADIETTLSVSYPLRSAKLRALCATDRAVIGRSKSIVYAGSNDVKGEIGREAVGRVWGAHKGSTDKAIVRRPQVDVKVFRLEGPIPGVHPFNTTAGRPADVIFIR